MQQIRSQAGCLRCIAIGLAIAQVESRKERKRKVNTGLPYLLIYGNRSVSSMESDHVKRKSEGLSSRIRVYGPKNV